MDPSLLMSMFGGGGQGGGGFGAQGFGGGGGGLSQFLGGLFGRSDRPYKEAGKTLEDYLGRAAGYQNPFFEFGQRAMPGFEQWLGGMKDPSGFINKMMGGYQESPYAKLQQEQALRASGNQGAAGGLGGSTPMAQFNQQNARDISSQDMNQWLQNVLGVNTQYGQGLMGQLGMGQHAGDIMSQLMSQFGGNIAGMRYGQEAGRNQDRSNIIGGVMNMFKRGLFG